MKLFLEDDNGAKVEVQEIEGVGDASNTLIVLCSVHLKPNDAKRIEAQISELTGKRCITLPPFIEKIVGV